jgi:hypothetical protein
MGLEVIGQADSKPWNEMVRNSINGTLFHSWEWLKIAEKYSGGKLYPLIYCDANDGKPFGAIPLFHIKKLGVRMVFSPPPGSAMTLGPVLLNKGYKQHKFELAYLEFQAQIDKFIKTLGANYVSFVTSPGLTDCRPFLWNKYSATPFYTYKIDLRQGEEAIWRDFSRTLRQDIKNSLTKGVHVFSSNISEDEALDYVYGSLYNRFYKQRLNLPFQKNYLQTILKEFGTSSIRLYLAKYQERIVGATIFIIYKDTISAWVGAARFESNDLEVNGCIYREAIIESIDHGYRWLEIMGANLRHLCLSKSKYCPQLDMYFQIVKNDLWGSLAEKTYRLMQKRL